LQEPEPDNNFARRFVRVVKNKLEKSHTFRARRCTAVDIS
jgi:hypothetical protein